MPLHDLHRKRRVRNLVLAASLLVLAVVFFLVTLVKFGG